MTLRGRCTCGNIEVSWHTVDYSVVPRACQCLYCRDKDVAYVSKSATRVDVIVHKRSRLKIVQQGSMSASFHECGHCGELVFVSVDLDNLTLGALNAACLDNPLGFASARRTDFGRDAVSVKMERWRANWCYPVNVVYLKD